MTTGSSSAESGVRGRLWLVARGAGVGAVVGWLLTVLAGEFLVIKDLVSLVRSGEFDQVGGLYGLLAVFVVATAWGAVAGVMAGLPVGAILGAAVGALIPRRVRPARRCDEGSGRANP